MVGQLGDAPPTCLELTAPDSTTRSLLGAFAGAGTSMIQLELNTKKSDGIVELPVLVFKEQQPSGMHLRRLPLLPLSTLREIAFPSGAPLGLDDWSEKRQVEFLLGRICARAAVLRASGSPTNSQDSPEDFSIQADRSCLWPKGWIGSLTHAHEPTTGISLVKATVLPVAQASGVGIDTEAWSRFAAHSRVTSRICREEELKLKDWDAASLTQGLNSGCPTGAEPLTQPQKTAILFSAKEAIYKALAPKVGRTFGFLAVRLTEVVSLSRGHLILQFETAEALTPSLPLGTPLAVRAFVSDPKWVHAVVVTSSCTPKDDSI